MLFGLLSSFEYVGLYTWLIFVSGFLFIAFGLFVFIVNKHDLTNKLFGILSLSYAAWIFSWFVMLFSAHGYADALFWARVLNFGAIWIPIIYFHWVLTILDQVKKRIKILLFGYFFVGIFSILAFSPWYIDGVRAAPPFEFWPTPGILHIVFLVFGYGAIVIYSLILMGVALQKATGWQRYQIFYVMVGSLLGFGSGATNYLIMYGMDATISFWGLGIIAVPFMFGFASAKYRLMNIKVVTTEIFVALIIMIFIIPVVRASSAADTLTNIFLLVVVTTFSVFLMQSVVKEVEAREKNERLAKDLEHANDSLVKLLKMKSEFLNLVSHQLRTPLTAVVGFLEWWKTETVY